MDIKTVKHHKGETVITYDEYAGKEGVRSVVFKCTDAPKQEFSNAIANLRSLVKNVCGFDADFAGDFTVTGVSFSERKAGGEGAVIKAFKTLDTANGPLNVATPWRACSDGDDDPKATEWDEKQTELLLKVKELAEAYIDGDRTPAQAEIDFDAGDDEELEEAA